MNKLLKALVILAVTVAFGSLIAVINSDSNNLGSIGVGQEYHATTTSDMTANEKHAVNAYVLGQVVVASTSDHQVALYDATSTDAVTDGTFSTRIGTLDNNISEGTYTFDAKLDNGLVVDLPSGYDGDYIILYR